MLYVKVNSENVPQEVPIPLRILKTRFPTVMFPKVLTKEFIFSLGYGIVHPMALSQYQLIERPPLHRLSPALPLPREGEPGVFDAQFELHPYKEGELEARWAVVRKERDDKIVACSWIIERHRDQKEAGLDTTLTEEQYQLYLAYRQALRDLPGNVEDPVRVVWPIEPVVTEGVSDPA